MAGQVNPRVLVIGLDAATFDVIDPWIEDGTLPNLQRLVREGAHGRLRSTIHPISPVAWSSAVTGKSPGKHGVFDWRERNPEIYHADFVDARSVNGPTVWQLLNTAEYTTGIFNVPLTYPPQSVNGYMVSGILTPSTSASFTYPLKLAKELHEVTGGYRVFFGKTYQEGREGLFLEAIHSTLEKRGRGILHLLKTRPTDFTMIVFMESDHIQHDFWKYMDTSFPGYRPEYTVYKHAIRDMFVALDDLIGQICAAVPDDTTIFVVSDHGTGPLYKMVYIDKYLVKQGLMQFKASPFVSLKRWVLENDLLNKAYRLATRLGIDARQLVPKEKRTHVLNAGMSSTDIDWKYTKAYSCGDFGQIAVNLQGRERFGCVPPAEYETVRDEIIASLRELRDPESGEAVVDDVYRREEIYEGPYISRAPDILFTMKDYSYLTSRTYGLGSDSLMEAFRFGNSGNSGSHRMDGIFIAHGPHIRSGHLLEEAQIIDLTPTVLYAMGLPLLDDMDGRVLTDIFEEAYVSDCPVKQHTQEDSFSQQVFSEPYSQTQADEVRQRLKELGYLD